MGVVCYRASLVIWSGKNSPSHSIMPLKVVFTALRVLEARYCHLVAISSLECIHLWWMGSEMETVSGDLRQFANTELCSNAAMHLYLYSM